jgi:hypothetical protein
MLKPPLMPCATPPALLRSALNKMISFISAKSVATRAAAAANANGASQDEAVTA